MLRNQTTATQASEAPGHAPDHAADRRATAGVDGATRSSELHLLVRSEAERGRDFQVLVPGAGVSYLVQGRTRRSRSTAALKRCRPRRACLALEPVLGPVTGGLESAGQPRLLVLVPRGLGVRWNALPAPPVLLLRAGDELRLPGGPLLHLSEYVSAGIGPPPAELVGRPCAVCRLPLTADASVLVCRGCGVPLHAATSAALDPDPESRPDREALDCAALAETCPACDSALRAGGEYSWLPEGAEVARA